MKKSFLLFILVTALSYFTVFAQPVLTSSTAPKLGDVISNTLIVAVTLSPGPPGANQTWDFSNVKSYGISTGAYVNPHSSYFPSANLELTDSASDNYYHIDSDEIDYLGGAEQDGYTSLSNSEKLLSFPFTYNDAYTDTFSGTGAESTTFLLNCWGYVKVKADAYGTLKTPAGTFENVLRVSVRAISSDTFPGLGYGEDFATQSYTWYMDGFRSPLFQLVFDTAYISSRGIVDPFLSGYYSNNTPAGVKIINGEEDISIYPNPASNFFQLSNLPIQTTALQYSIFNTLGQVKQSNTLTPGNTSASINVSALPVGVYFIGLTDNKGVVWSGKFVKE